MKTIITLFLLQVTLLMTPQSLAESQNIYMMAKAKFKNTTFTEIVFFDDPEINSLEKCDREKEYGLRGKWQYFGHRVNRYKGAALGVNYYCVSTPLNIAIWYDKNRYNYVYLVSLEGRHVALELQENYAACMGALRQTQPDETAGLFCAKANQKLKPTP